MPPLVKTGCHLHILNWAEADADTWRNKEALCGEATTWDLRPMKTIFCSCKMAHSLSFFLHNPASNYKTRDDSGAHRAILLCHLLLLFSLMKDERSQPSTNPHMGLRRVTPIDSPLPMCYAKDIHKGSPWDPPMADFISWAAFVIYIAVSPPLPSPAVIPEQDVARKSFSLSLPTTHWPAYFYKSCYFPYSLSVRSLLRSQEFCSWGLCPA